MSSRIDRRSPPLDLPFPTGFGPNESPAQRDPAPSNGHPSSGRLSRRLPHGTLPPSSPSAAVGRVPVPSVLVHGRSRPLVNLLLYAVAQNANPEFRWLDIRAAADAPPHWDPVRLGWIESTHVWTADPVGGLEPDHVRGNAALFEVVRSDEPPETLAQLADFLRLPSKVQEILGEMTPAGDGNVLAVANADRISESFPESTLAPILAAFAWAHCSLFVGYTGPPPHAAQHFSHVVRIEGDSPTLWRNARIHFERDGLPGGSRPGSTVSPSEVPFVERVFRRAHL